ncbi:MAG: recombinase family protein [Oscillospiraceae bacterium]|jgi:DNA invertase Pin-like site-specific DNA recombinase|nr:recombinase family protein [Oscillospiraceae bacterium]
MRTVQKLEPLQMPPPRRKRTAAYARVSCEKDAMLQSLAAQVGYYADYIRRRPDWEFAGVFADEVTGTKDSREQFQQLLADCRAGKVDIVITKSISRLARNTVTLLDTVRELMALGVAVYFERERIWTDTGEGELALSLLAAFAQEESRSVSENCRWRIRKQFKEGVSTPCSVFGYKMEQGTFVVVPEEAAVVRQIFADYLAGMGILAIQKKLLAQGQKFSKNGLAGLIRNEKYVGDLLLQKSLTTDHLSKRKLKNTGQLPQYLVPDHHPAIVSREQFDAVQREIARRAAAHKSGPRPEHPCKFTGLIRCGICGAPFGHKIAGAAAKYKKPVWICHTFNTLGKAHCASQMIPEDILLAKTAEAGGFKGLQRIEVPGAFQLAFYYKDGKQVDLTWKHPSRRESWTQEMRDATRERSKK